MDAVGILTLYPRIRWARGSLFILARRGDEWRAVTFLSRNTSGTGSNCDFRLDTPSVMGTHETICPKLLRATISQWVPVPENRIGLIYNNAIRSCYSCGTGRALPEKLNTDKFWTAAWDCEWKMPGHDGGPVDISPLLHDSYPAPMLLELCAPCRKYIVREYGAAFRFRDVLEYNYAGRFSSPSRDRLRQRYEQTWPRRAEPPVKRAAARQVRRLVQRNRWPAISTSARNFFTMILGANALAKLTNQTAP